MSGQCVRPRDRPRPGDTAGGGRWCGKFTPAPWTWMWKVERRMTMEAKKNKKRTGKEPRTSVPCRRTGPSHASARNAQSTAPPVTMLVTKRGTDGQSSSKARARGRRRAQKGRRREGRKKTKFHGLVVLSYSGRGGARWRPGGQEARWTWSRWRDTRSLARCNVVVALFSPLFHPPLRGSMRLGSWVVGLARGPGQENGGRQRDPRRWTG